MPENIKNKLKTLSELELKLKKLTEENEKLKKLLEQYEKTINFKFVEEEQDYKTMIHLLSEVFRQKLLKPTDHLFKLIKVQLLCINIGDMRGSRWRDFDEGLVHWALT
eukprot:Pompholyxophrys_punicea_v1_NODE_168_length_3036_cov_10.830594.p4 type:complete len:108 gc:universal NODE_168_length_3036_cov_10.830594:886-1209(+)